MLPQTGRHKSRHTDQDKGSQTHRPKTGKRRHTYQDTEEQTQRPEHGHTDTQTKNLRHTLPKTLPSSFRGWYKYQQ